VEDAYIKLTYQIRQPVVVRVVLSATSVTLEIVLDSLEPRNLKEDIVGKIESKVLETLWQSTYDSI
jgi:hypothetical protein